MAPHSPFPGLPISVESRAPILPLTRPYTQLISGQSISQPGLTDIKQPNTQAHPHPAKTFTPHLPGRPHRPPRYAYTGLSSFVFTILLVMLIGGSGAMYRYQTMNGGRRSQSVMDVVRVAYFERDMIPQPPIAIAVLGERDAPPASASPAPPKASASSKGSFKDGDDVKDPSAVKPDEGENKQPADPDPEDDTPSASASDNPSAPQPTAPPAAAKRHWSSRSRRAVSHKRKRRFWKGSVWR